MAFIRRCEDFWKHCLLTKANYIAAHFTPFLVVSFSVTTFESRISFLYCSTPMDFPRFCIKRERCCLFWSYLLEAFNWRTQGGRILKEIIITFASLLYPLFLTKGVPLEKRRLEGKLHQLQRAQRNQRHLQTSAGLRKKYSTQFLATRGMALVCLLVIW